jgi:prevent-host-death family protein
VARTVNIHEAKTHLSKLLEAVESGEEVIIARSGRPIARLSAVPSEPHRKKRKPGFAKGLIPDSALAALLDPALDQRIAELFYAGSLSPDEGSHR